MSYDPYLIKDLASVDYGDSEFCLILKKKRIVVAPIPKIGIGKTINERLDRASF